MFEHLEEKNSRIAVIGLGYVGLPVALELSSKFSVIGFDINPNRIEDLKNFKDPDKEIAPDKFKGKDLYFTSKKEEIQNASFYIVAVPTPIDASKNPNLNPLKAASATVGSLIKNGDVVVYESTVFPGCTEEICLPILERESGLIFNKDFFLGYSPERINPGDKKHTLSKITKVVSGSDDFSLNVIDKVYSSIIEAGTHRASTIKVAEAAKVIENTQRDLNIALMNELSLIFNKLDINTYEVLEAAGTKWNFLKFYPGLVGGHCIGVDPYYLTYKSLQTGHNPEVILSGRRVNDEMGTYVGSTILKNLASSGKVISDSKILVLGITFKENVTDIRNSKIIDIINEIKSYGIIPDVYDPLADEKSVMELYNIDLIEKPKESYDAVILAVSHASFIQELKQDVHHWQGIDSWFFDLKGIFRDKKSEFKNYWSL